ncbi:hypothetical protein [Actinophytocola sp.]|jgi:hypothetical protein|uniref:hypothetical protein n=1 Tax=Actinophytocola sp. TaxID=1872138 RepID=UPI002ED82F09
MADIPVANVLLFAVAVIAPTLLFWILLRMPHVVDGVGERIRRRRLPAVTAPPIERLAADLRRVHRSLAECPPGTPAVRRQAARQAYDALLGQACAAVDVPHRLDALPEGIERELERLRVEEALRQAGLTIP